MMFLVDDVLFFKGVMMFVVDGKMMFLVKDLFFFRKVPQTTMVAEGQGVGSFGIIK